mgnify:CR=1 FL=1
MKKLQLISIMLVVPFMLRAQAFISGVSELHPSKDCIVELTDGSEMKAGMSSAVIINGFLKTVTLKDENGVKTKLKADEIRRLKVKADALAKLDMMAESTSSVKELIKTDYNDIIDREYIIYEQALLPKKKDKYRLLQLLNPGFDHRIKVYQDPDAKETMGLSLGDVQLTGGEDKSYLVVKDGAKSVVVKKNKYKKDFPELFGDCSIGEIIDSGKVKFKNFAAHVFVYDQICGDKK